MEQENKSSPEIVLQRLQLIGEGIIPDDEFPFLPKQDSIWIFLHERDPERWPREMSHLKKYLNRKGFFV